MKAKHVVFYRAGARATLEWCDIPVGADFHTLRSAQVDKLLVSAEHDRYQKPSGANGSLARYYHDRLQRHAKMG